jgi:nitrogen regulatory protein PII
MKYIIAVIQPFQLENVKDALTALGIKGMTVSEVRGYGRQKGQVEIYRGSEYDVSFVPKVKIEVAVSEAQLDEVVGVIQKQAVTGKIGDGKIFVLPLENAIRIRTSESGEGAL